MKFFPTLVFVSCLTMMPIYFAYVNLGMVGMMVVGFTLLAGLGQLRLFESEDREMRRTVMEKFGDILWDRWYPKDE